MSLIAPSAFVDFVSDLSLEEVGSLLSARLFANIPFTGLGEGLWDEVPAMRLAQRFMGLQVELGGSPGTDGGYTLQVEMAEFPWALIAPDAGKSATVDLSGTLQHLLQGIEPIRL